jgi:hypothetical protein
MKTRKTCLWLAAVCLIGTTVAMGEVPNYINFQGTLCDSTGNPVTGTYNMQFSIYGDSTGGSSLWNEAHPSVEVTDGVFNLLLGTVNVFQDSLFNGQERWLEHTIGGQILSPRTKMASVPYAIKDNCWMSSGDDCYLDKDGNVGIGVTSPSVKLDVAGNIMGQRFQDQSNTSYYVDPANANISAVLKGSVGIGGAPYQFGPPLYGGPDLHFNKDTSFVEIWIGDNRSSGEIGNLNFMGYASSWMNPAAYAGIGATIINNSMFRQGALSFYTATGDPLPAPGWEEQMRINPDGYVGIGTNDPWYKLHVIGSVYVDSASSDGVRVEQAGGHGLRVNDASTHGVCVTHADDNGIHVASTGGHGVSVLSADDCGIDASGDHGNHLRSEGSGHYGLYAHSLWDEPTNPGLYVHGTTTVTGQITSDLTTGTAPLDVSSTTRCDNLNADMLDGAHGTKYLYDMTSSNRGFQGACAQYSDNTYISFSTPFSYYPIVVATPQSTGVIATVSSWSSSGFTLRLTNHNGTPYSGSTYVHWIAIGAR